MIFGLWRTVLRLGLALLAALVLYIVVTGVQVWLTSRQYARARPGPSWSWARPSTTGCPRRT